MPSKKSKIHHHIRRIVRTYRTVSYDCRAFERIVPAVFIAIALLAVITYLLLLPPKSMVTPLIAKVDSNQTLGQIASSLESQHVVRSSLLFEILVRVLGGNRRVEAGAYFFPARQNLFAVALRFETGDFELNPVRVYIPEGATVQNIAGILNEKLQPFDKEQFVAVAKPHEGYLFPDTYFFFPGQDPSVIVKALEDNYNKHVALIAPELEAAKEPVADIVKAASILVGEARTDRDRRIVAGIIWKRIKIGMPLQVDAPFGYILDKNLTQLTAADLQIDSPYNTYKNKGLPPTPINSPSLEAITAAAEPIKTPYLFYLSDRNGVMRYSVTYQQHLQKIRQYL